MLGIAFPSLMEICVLWPENFGRLKFHLWKNIVLILIGIAGLIVGTYKSVFDIIVSFQTPLVEEIQTNVANLTTQLTQAIN